MVGRTTQVFVSEREGASRRDWVGTSAGCPAPPRSPGGSAAGVPASTGAPPTDGSARAGQEVVGECPRSAAEERSDDVDVELRPRRRPAEELVHQVGAERARRVDGPAGERTDEHDLGRDRQPDEEAGPAGGSPLVDRDRHDREDQQERPERLGDDALQAVDAGAESREAHAAEVGGPAADVRHDEQGTDEGTEQLRDHVRRDLGPAEASGRCQADGHGRVDVRTGRRADGVDDQGHHQTEGQGDDAQPAVGEAPAVHREGGDHRAGAEEDQQAGADELGEKTAGQ